MVHKLLPPFLIQQYEEEVQQLSKAMLDSTSDPSLLAVRLCRKGALLRKVSHSPRWMQYVRCADTSPLCIICTFTCLVRLHYLTCNLCTLF